MKKCISILILLAFIFSDTSNQIMLDSNKKNTLDLENKRKIKAFFLSAFFSGAGQFYLGQYKKSAIYAGVELAQWSFHQKYIDKSENFTNQYKLFADQNWSFDKWVRDYYSFNSESNAMYSAFINIESNEYFDPWDESHGIKFFINSNPTKIYNTGNQDPEFPPLYQQWCGSNYRFECNGNFDDYTEYITVIKDHHHYEGIGKYNVYFSGWIDAVSGESWVDTLENNYRLAMSDNKDFYENNLRLKSKKKHDVAENILATIFINHSLSMLDVLINFENKKQISINPYISLSENNKISKLYIDIKW